MNEDIILIVQKVIEPNFQLNNFASSAMLSVFSVLSNEYENHDENMMMSINGSNKPHKSKGYA